MLHTYTFYRRGAVVSGCSFTFPATTAMSEGTKVKQAISSTRSVAPEQLRQKLDRLQARQTTMKQ